MDDSEKVYLVGDVRYTQDATGMYETCKAAPIDFLLSLQSLMEEYGVVKVDLSTDAFRYVKCKSL